MENAGEQLASGADGGILNIWKSHSTDAGQVWVTTKSLMSHHDNVLDLQWSKDDEFLISGSLDNSCIIWDVNKGSVHQILDSHTHYVQGVAWDPLAKYVASLSSDRTCRIYVNKPSKAKGTERMNYVCQHIISQVEPQISEDSKSARSHIFHDERLPSFFRRLEWAPDGSFLLVPAGIYKLKTSAEPVNSAYIFSRRDLSRPALMLPGASKPVIAVRFCPLAFKLRESKPSTTLFKLPYRFIFAVATLDSLYIYDTESVQPIAVVAGLHYEAVTDIAWSPTGKYLALSSHDGYCTLFEFESEELGLTVSSLEPVEVKDENKTPIYKQEKSVEVTLTKSDNAECGEMVVEVMEQAEETQTDASGPMEVEAGERLKTTLDDTDIAACRDMEVQVVEPTGAKVNDPVPTKPVRKRITPVAID
ncbi:hypothetical protein Leryth_011065 [Lithospermum erythrorhizon]|nr:hypothetical protein Leryth_011065 [Lithospermum erythrorhizon]